MRFHQPLVRLEPRRRFHEPIVRLESRVCLMGHGVGPYIGLNEIGSPNLMKTFITINYLFNFIFGFIR